MKTNMGAPGACSDLQLAFDVGHSSLGWAVLQSSAGVSPAANAPRVNILGCGVVTFGADDCLASKRRDYRRQRRHARATRQRIAQMEKLLAHLKVLSAEQAKKKPLDKCPATVFKKRLLLQVSSLWHGVRTACVPNFVLIPI